MITLYSNGLTSVWHILGVGAIGMRWARKLKQAGEPVTLILRDEAKLREFVSAGSGIRYLSHVGEEFIPFPATSLNDPALRIENLLLCTKSYSLAAAYEAVVQKVVAGANLVLLCNGYECSRDWELMLARLGFGQRLQRAAPTPLHPFI